MQMNEDIKLACQIMERGGVILYPTDTIWGIGCDATNEEAVKRVFEIKRRADSKAMLVLVDTPVKLNYYVKEVPEVAWDLIEMADKPMTIIYEGARNGAKLTGRGWKRGHTSNKRDILTTSLPTFSETHRINLGQCEWRGFSRQLQRNQRGDQTSCGLHCGKSAGRGSQS